MATRPTVRTRILRHLKKRFEAVQEGVDDHVLTWNTIVRRPLTDMEMQAGNAIAILDISEEKKAEAGFMRCTIRVATEFWTRSMLGDEASDLVNEIMGDVQKTIGEDINATETLVPLCQLTIAMTENSNEVEIDGASDTIVGGVVLWDILYRHKHGDPTRLSNE